MLNRWLAVKQGQSSLSRSVRRLPLSEVTSLAEAEARRAQIVARIGSKVVAIQNPALGEARTRDINDLINRLIVQKTEWEEVIQRLGGREYSRSTAADIGIEAAIVVNVEGSQYYYFGAARELPGVKELLGNRKEEIKRKRQRVDLNDRVNARYYGLHDESGDAVMLEQEKSAEKQWVNSCWGELSIEQAIKLARDIGDIEEEIVPMHMVQRRQGVEEKASTVEMDQDEKMKFEHKKAELLKKYGHLLSKSSSG
jgi:pre-mRNA-splicing factor ISY1